MTKAHGVRWASRGAFAHLSQPVLARNRREGLGKEEGKAEEGRPNLAKRNKNTRRAQLTRNTNKVPTVALLSCLSGGGGMTSTLGKAAEGDSSDASCPRGGVLGG